MRNNQIIKVWDLPVRIFHWSLVLSFLLAYLSEDDWLDLHVLAGYSIAGLISFRLLWGFIGSRHARFRDFIRSPRMVISYLKDVLAFRAKRYLGHNPAGGAMVIALLLSLLFTTLSGLVVYGTEEMAGPLAGLLSATPHWLGEVLEEIHEFFANLTLLLVIAHVVGVVIASLQHRENLVHAMFTGKKHLDHET